MKRLDCENKLLSLTEKGMLDSPFRVADTFTRYTKRLQEALGLYVAGLAMSATQRFGAWCDEDESELKYASWKNILE